MRIHCAELGDDLKGWLLPGVQVTYGRGSRLGERLGRSNLLKASCFNHEFSPLSPIHMDRLQHVDAGNGN